MNILLINHYVGSPKYGMEFRPYYLGKHWVKQGHNVFFIGASHSHLRQEQPIVKRNFTLEEIDGIKYIWIKTPKYNSSLKRILNILIFVIKLFFYAKKISKLTNSDCVIASSTHPLDIYPCNKIAHISKAKLIFEVHDLWPLSPMLIGGYSKYHPFILLMQAAENFAYEKSDKVVSLLWNAKEHMIKHGMQADKLVFIPNGFNKDEWIENHNKIPHEHSDLFCRLKAEDKIIIGYAGGHTPSTSMHTFIKAAKILKDNGKLAFVLIGNGISKNELIEQVKDLSLSNVFFLPPVNKNVIPIVINQFDIAYMGGVHSILHKYGTSFNKMTDYMLCSKPIISSVDEPGCLIERVNCGIRVEAENPQKVADAILKLAAMSPEEREVMGKRGRDYVVENLEYGYLARKMIDFIFQK